MRNRVTSFLLAPLVLAASPSTASDLNKGMEAFDLKDGEKALELLIPLAKKGIPKAQAAVGQIYYEGSRIYPGITRDAELAWFWIKKAANNGDAVSQVFLADEYLFGTGNNGIPNAPELAVVWLRKAANQGNISAICDMGMCYREGRGVPADCKESIVWYRKAAKKGSEAAMTWIGRMYAKGTGVIQDYTEAHAWFILAASQSNGNSKVATDERDYLANQLNSSQVEKAQLRAKALAKELGI